MRYNVLFLHVVRYPWKLYLNLVIFAGFGQACQGMSKVLQNNKATISMVKVELLCLFVACSYTSMEATELSCCFSCVWSGVPKVLWSNKSPTSLERVLWFCRFFASSYLHLVNADDIAHLNHTENHKFISRNFLRSIVPDTPQSA